MHKEVQGHLEYSYQDFETVFVSNNDENALSVTKKINQFTSYIWIKFMFYSIDFVNLHLVYLEIWGDCVVLMIENFNLYSNIYNFLKFLLIFNFFLCLTKAFNPDTFFIDPSNLKFSEGRSGSFFGFR